MTQHSFNVLHDPWIPVVRLDGGREELGILPALFRAHELASIRDPAPIIEFGLYRMLVAFVLDAFTLAGEMPEDVIGLRELLQEGRFQRALLEDYAAQCGDVFDLFHHERPFLQSPSVAGEDKPIAAVYSAVPSGTNVSLWHHAHETAMGATPAECTRILATVAPFMTAGGQGLSPSINGAPPIYVLPCGATLYATLIMNLPLRGQSIEAPTAAWCSRRTPGGERKEPPPMAEALTWRPRRMLLSSPGTDGRVRTMKLQAGDKTRFLWIDPHLAYRYEKDTATPVRLREGRPLWRDTGPLALLDQTSYSTEQGKVKFQRPDVVDQAARLEDGPIRLRAYAMRTDMKMKVYEWAAAELVIPSSLGRSTRLGAWVQMELDRSGKAAVLMREAVRSLFPRKGAGNASAPRREADRAERTYWSVLEPEFRALMERAAAMTEDGLDDLERAAAAAAPWREAIRTTALASFEQIADDMDSDSDALERAVNARGRLVGGLKKVIS